MAQTRAARRRMLRMLLAGGVLGAAGASGVISRALAKGDLPPGVNRLEGSAEVNGRPARIGTPVNLGDRRLRDASPTLAEADVNLFLARHVALRPGSSERSGSGDGPIVAHRLLEPRDLVVALKHVMTG